MVSILKTGCLGLFLFTVGIACTQSDESGQPDPDGHRSNPGAAGAVVNPDDPYGLFSEGYRTLDAEWVASSYSADALLINAYEGSVPASFHGRDRILDFFHASMMRAADENASLHVAFKLASREMLDDRVLDNGYYRVRVIAPGGDEVESNGKFSIVLEQEDGKWKFSVDANSSASREEYDESKGRIIGSAMGPTR